eukprot:6190621-Pyramimonas_sp.AAC.1
MDLAYLNEWGRCVLGLFPDCNCEASQPTSGDGGISYPMHQSGGGPGAPSCAERRGSCGGRGGGGRTLERRWYSLQPPPAALDSHPLPASWAAFPKTRFRLRPAHSEIKAVHSKIPRLGGWAWPHGTAAEKSHRTVRANPQTRETLP